MAFTIPSRDWKSNEAKWNRSAMARRRFLPRSVAPSLYSSRWEKPSSPSSSRMTRRAMSSMSEVAREKFRYLQPKRMGGQAERIWTERAPFS